MDYTRFLEEAGVEEHYWGEALASLEKSHSRFYPRVLITK